MKKEIKEKLRKMISKKLPKAERKLLLPRALIKKREINHKCFERVWESDPNSYMKFGFVENAHPAHDVIYYEFNFRKEAKTPESSIHQQTLIESSQITLEEAMTIINGLSEAIRTYIWWKEEKTKKRLF